MCKICPWCLHLRRRSRALQAGRHLLHGSRILRYGLWRSWGRSAWSTGLEWFLYCFFSFIFLSVDAHMCLFFPSSSTLIHAGTPARLASGNVCCLSEAKKVVYKRLKLAEWNVKRCVFPKRGCSMQIFNSPALPVDSKKVKKSSNAKMKIK